MIQVFPFIRNFISTTHCFPVLYASTQRTQSHEVAELSSKVGCFNSFVWFFSVTPRGPKATGMLLSILYPITTPVLPQFLYNLHTKHSKPNSAEVMILILSTYLAPASIGGPVITKDFSGFSPLLVSVSEQKF